MGLDVFDDKHHKDLYQQLGFLYLSDFPEFNDKANDYDFG